MSTPLPLIYLDCLRLLVLIEDMVRRFSREHKNTVGFDLRVNHRFLFLTEKRT